MKIQITIFSLALLLSSCTGGLGPKQVVQNATVEEKYVSTERSGESVESHYMVVTDKGVFEVDNGLLLNVWNADELYGSIQKGRSYNITTKGKKS